MKEESFNSDQKKRITRILGICVLVGIIVYLLLARRDSISVAVQGDYLSLSYSAGGTFEIKYKDIHSVTEIQDLELGNYVSGSQTNQFKFGVWKNSRFGEYDLCIYTNVTRYIVIETKDRTYVLNFESADATESLYKAFQELLQTKKSAATP
jgi:hypothetical protein